MSGFVKNAPAVLNGKYAEVIFREYVKSAVPTDVLTGTTKAGGGSGSGSGSGSSGGTGG